MSTEGKQLTRSLEGAREAFSTQDTEALKVAHDLGKPSKEPHQG